MLVLQITEINVNRLAQKFYEASRLSEIPMTAKDQICDGLTAVFEELGIEVTN